MGTPRETHIQKRAKIEPKPIEEQPVEEVKEESCQDCSDTEDSSSSQSSSTTEADNIESDLESLEEHYYSDLRRYTANLESAFSEQLNHQQLNNQEWNFYGPRRYSTLPHAPYHLASGKADVPDTGFKKANGDATTDVLLRDRSHLCAGDRAR